MEEALAAEVFAGVSDRMAFRRDLLRQAVYEGLPASVRITLHRDATDALQRTGASVGRIAGQLVIGARPEDAAAIELVSSSSAQPSGCLTG